MTNTTRVLLPAARTVRSGGLPRSSSLLSGANSAPAGAASATRASASASAGAAGRRAKGAGTAARSACSSSPSWAFSLYRGGRRYKVVAGRMALRECPCH